MPHDSSNSRITQTAELDWLAASIERDFTEPCANQCRYHEVSNTLEQIRRDVKQEVERRDKILEGVNIACTHLIRTRRWQDEIDDLLRILGEASDSDRSTVFRVAPQPDGRMYARLLHAWDIKGIPLVDNPAFHKIDIAAIGLEELLIKFDSGQPHYYHRAERGEDKMLVKDTQTGLHFPLFCKGELWGALGFYMTRDTREWTPVELNTLQIAADVLSAAIERQISDEELRHNEERLRQAVRLSKMGVWEWDFTNDRLEWDDEMLRIFGITREEFSGVGSEYAHYTREDFLEAQYASIARTFHKGITYSDLVAGKSFESEPMEMVIVRKDGSECWIAGDTIGIVDAEQNPLRLFGVTMDLTEHKQAQAALRERDRLQSALEKEIHLNNIKTKLMRTITHEFRTPLAAILSSASLLETYADRYSPEDYTRKLQGIQAQVHNLNRIVEEVSHDVYDMFEGRGFHAQQSNLELLCETNLEEIHMTLGSKHVMHFVSDGALKSVFVDERLVHRILINLLSNAIKYSPEGTEIYLRLNAEYVENVPYAVIEVVDHGYGMTPEDQKLLFVPFFRAANAKGIPGTGLGLSIVLDCVNQHNGTIHVQSAVDKGTTFTVRLPLLKY